MCDVQRPEWPHNGGLPRKSNPGYFLQQHTFSDSQVMQFLFDNHLLLSPWPRAPDLRREGRRGGLFLTKTWRHAVCVAQKPPQRNDVCTRMHNTSTKPNPPIRHHDQAPRAPAEPCDGTRASYALHTRDRDVRAGAPSPACTLSTPYFYMFARLSYDDPLASAAWACAPQNPSQWSPQGIQLSCHQSCRPPRGRLPHARTGR